MRVYIIRRLLLIIPTVLITSLIVFSMIRLIPGSIVDIMVEQFGAYAKMNRADVESELGLNVPIVTQYGRWIGVVPQADGKISGVLEGNLGDSLWHGTPVIDEIESQLAGNSRTCYPGFNNRSSNSFTHRHIFIITAGYLG